MTSRLGDVDRRGLVFRSLGGPTRLDNLTTLCAKCHGLLHEGFLEIDSHLEIRDKRGVPLTP